MPFDSKAFLKTLSTSPGIYKMLSAEAEVLYVGKARNLKNRLQSYFRTNALPEKTKRLMEKVSDIEITITHSDTEALLLETTLIKQYRPPYNVIFRDDKSYPYIFISNDVPYPKMVLYRGAKKKQGKYYGPYPGLNAARVTLNILQKIFKIRHCENSFFKNRTRPCLQYQIQRCSAPCVDFISPEQYQDNLRLAELFLQGKNQTVIDTLINKMEQASENFEYEQAAKFRDQIAKLKQVQTQQGVISDQADTDILAVFIEQSRVVVSMVFIRNGQMLGSRSFFPKAPQAIDEAEVLSQFLPQFYLAQVSKIPKEIIVQTDFEERVSLSESLSSVSGRKVVISYRVKTEKKRWLEMALQNAKYTLRKLQHDKAHTFECLQQLTEALSLPSQPRRIECFDVSHTMGEATVASCVVFDAQGPVKQDYRRFNITEVQAGDDYGALKQALTRRYVKLKNNEEKMPELIVIDGGKGQLSIAKTVLNELQISDVFLMAISKGQGRKPGFETLHIALEDQSFILPPDSLALHMLQQVRDEAHRFAITGHRKQRGKKQQQSILEVIPGVGPNRRRELLRRFGGLQELKNTSVEELAKTPGISPRLAQLIFDALHS